MNKGQLIKLVDLLCFLGLLALISTGLLLEFTLPARSGAASVWGLTRHEWGDLHFYISLGFLVLMSLHLFLHIGFIKKAILGRASREHKYRLAIGLVGLVALLILLLAPVFSPVENTGERRGRHQWENAAGHID